MAAKPPTLYHIEISHYNEKARWALDYKGISHVLKAPPPIMHMAVAYRLTRKPTFPILVLNGDAISDSTRIIERLERDHPDPPLYPADEQQRRRALELEEHFDEQLGPHIRRWLFHQALEELPPADLIDGALGSSPRGVKTMLRATGPVGRGMLRMRYGIKPAAAEASRVKTEEAIDRVEAELQPSGYLVGDSFSIADLTAAALLFPLVRPPEAPFMMPGPMPPSFIDLQQSMSSRPGYQWGEEMYRRHRGRSAALPA